jgi:hypothetical protein
MSDAIDIPEQFVPDEIIPHRRLPPLRFRDLPEAPRWTKLLGPSIMLAGLALGSGEFIFWPYLTYKTGFVFFWACMVGALTQFFINMEIERWTLLTGESATTGFCRLSHAWASVFLLLNFLPWIWPGWATGAATLLSWLFFGAQEVATATGVEYKALYVPYIAIGGMLFVGLMLTTGPVVYNTVERVQVWLVALICAIAVLIGCLVIRADAVVAMLSGVANNFGSLPTEQHGIDLLAMLGAIAFAGAGGTMNLGQSNFIKDKGYAMGRYVGRITSPITGNEEAVSDVGYHFPHTPENMRRWRDWWRAANIEHFFSFYVTCVVCLVLLSLISYSLFYDASGNLKPGMERFGKDMNFVWGEAGLIEGLFALPTVGKAVRFLFFVMGVAILFTTELGVLDATSRISTDIIKVNFLRENENWSAGRLYFLILWGQIAIGCAILLAGTLVSNFSQPLFLLKTSAAMNGGVMFLYSMILLYLNSKILPRSLAITPLRFVMLIWACGFFGYFTILALKLEVLPFLFG